MLASRLHAIFGRSSIRNPRGSSDYPSGFAPSSRPNLTRTWARSLRTCSRRTVTVVCSNREGSRSSVARLRARPGGGGLARAAEHRPGSGRRRRRRPSRSCRGRRHAPRRSTPCPGSRPPDDGDRRSGTRRRASTSRAPSPCRRGAHLRKRQDGPVAPGRAAPPPGVLVQKTAPLQSSPYIRGFTGYRNLMLIDAIRLNNSAMRAGPNQYWSTIDRTRSTGWSWSAGRCRSSTDRTPSAAP